MVEANDLLKLGTDHTLRIALDIATNSDATDLVHGRLADIDYAAALMWDWRIAPALTATNAVRIDHAEVSYSGVPTVASGLTSAAFNAVRITEPA